MEGHWHWPRWHERRGVRYQQPVWPWSLNLKIQPGNVANSTNRGDFDHYNLWLCGVIRTFTVSSDLRSRRHLGKVLESGKGSLSRSLHFLLLWRKNDHHSTINENCSSLLGHREMHEKQQPNVNSRIRKSLQQSTTRTNDGGFVLYSGAKLVQYVPILLVQPTHMCLNHHGYEELITDTLERTTTGRVRALRRLLEQDETLLRLEIRTVFYKMNTLKSR